jgi:RNA polymerase I-specific transcription initiation factor RRN7
MSTAQTPDPPGHIPADEDISSRRAETGTEGPEEEKTNDDDKADSSSDSEGGDQTEKEEGEGPDADLLAELSDLSELSDLDDGDTGNIGKKGPKWKRRRRLRVSDTLVTLIIGLWILRVPVMNVDIES